MIVDCLDRGRIEGEAQYKEKVNFPVFNCLARGLLDVSRVHRPVLGAERNGNTRRRTFLSILADTHSRQSATRDRLYGLEAETLVLVAVLYTGFGDVLQDSLGV